MTKLVQVRRKPVEVGVAHAWSATTGVVRRDGYVLAHGELWRARTADESDARAGRRTSSSSASTDASCSTVRPAPAAREPEDSAGRVGSRA